MCPECAPLAVTRFAARQRGFLLPVALFIVVAMGLFALALGRMTAQTHVAALQETLSVQAFYAAESGAQEAMSRLFYPDASSRQQVDSQCAALTSLNRSYGGIAGLNACGATIRCACVDELGAPCTPAAGFSFYTLTSVGECDAGNLRAVRTLQVSAFMAQE